MLALLNRMNSKGSMYPMSTTKTYHIIIADDTDSVRGLLARIITRIYSIVRITAANDGVAALEVFDREGADLVITNNEMAQMNGLVLITALRQRNALVPIVMVAGNTVIEPQARAAGASAFIAKPFKVADVTQVLLALLPRA